MATVKPFAAVRPRSDLAAQVSVPPYDVLSEAEARALAAPNPLSFLRVSRPEVGLSPGTDPHSPAAYAEARRAYQALLERGVLRRDPQPAFYLYRQVMGAHSQTGIVGAASCREYRTGVVRRHELTRPDKEDDRARHIEALNAQTGPAFLFYRAEAELAAFIRDRTSVPPEVDFTAPDGVRHSTWTVADAEGIAFLESRLAAQPRLYIADGHHRTAAAARVWEARGARAEADGFLSVIFAHDTLQILPYHRVVRDLNGLSAEALLARLRAVGEVRPGGAGQPAARHEVGVFLAGQWWTLRFRPELAAGDNPAETLDVALLQRHVLEPLLGITDPRRSERIDFVGGVRGPEELERRVRSGAAAVAFALYPTGIDELMAVADRGEIMPPKSTWFEPKLRDALFCLPL
jgi:uncharacterized protein (DUF1015 family)